MLRGNRKRVWHEGIQILSIQGKLLGKVKSFALMKKHYKAYVTGWPGADQLRQELMKAPNVVIVEEIIDKYLANVLH